MEAELEVTDAAVAGAVADAAAILDRPGVRLVREALRANGIGGEVRVLPETAPSAVAAAEQIGCGVGAIANSLVFEADGAPLLVLRRRCSTELSVRLCL